MHLFVIDHPYHYEAENLCRVFFPFDKVITLHSEAEAEEPQNRTVYTALRNTGAPYYVRIEDETGVTERTGGPETEEEYGMMALLFDALQAHTGKTPRWGMLTGIHPIKLLRQLTEKFGEVEAGRLFREKYFVSEEKAAIAERTLRTQTPVTMDVHENDYSLYISVPFCPTRCAYCSFVSQSVEKTKKQIPVYHKLLMEEITATAAIAKDLGLTLRSVYVGGGTPTTFDAPQLSEMIRTVRASFDMTQCEEFTVEAGRPDTIDRAKLEALLSGGVTRISINPQTLQDNVLENIGRRHTAQQTVDAFRLAREVGFDNINMDLIVGLPGDTFESFCDTIEKVLELDPENVTVHSLALKRSSFITQSGEVNQAHADALLADHMMAYAERRLTESGFEPYYLYRQSRMAGNLENTGWAKPGFVCAYNIFTMDETETVLACGAGGVSKLKDPYSEELCRIFNFKYSYEYISRYEEILERKGGIAEKYEQFRKRIHQIHQSSGTDQ
ncbi:MAG: coproporphyrinogen dehydrogenase HemZ [Clostridia bacterium]|nr:coproporphyrinogen dehydrogenase HemZ [Clostridia bacterium]